MTTETEKTIVDYYKDIKNRCPKDEIKRQFNLSYCYDPSTCSNRATASFYYAVPPFGLEYVKFQHACRMYFGKDLHVRFSINRNVINIEDQEELAPFC
jgi:hypothetical protein